MPKSIGPGSAGGGLVYLIEVPDPAGLDLSESPAFRTIRYFRNMYFQVVNVLFSPRVLHIIS